MKNRRKNRQIIFENRPDFALTKTDNINPKIFDNVKNLTIEFIEGNVSITLYGKIMKEGARISYRSLEDGVTIANKLLVNYSVYLYKEAFIMFTNDNATLFVACLVSGEK